MRGEEISDHSDDDLGVNFYKCMPSAFPKAVKMIDEIYNLYSQKYINLAESGPIIDFTCEFVEDLNGTMYFLKIKDYMLAGKERIQPKWVLSTEFEDN